MDGGFFSNQPSAGGQPSGGGQQQAAQDPFAQANSNVPDFFGTGQQTDLRGQQNPADNSQNAGEHPANDVLEQSHPAPIPRSKDGRQANNQQQGEQTGAQQQEQPQQGSENNQPGFSTENNNINNGGQNQQLTYDGATGFNPGQRNLGNMSVDLPKLPWLTRFKMWCDPHLIHRRILHDNSKPIPLPVLRYLRTRMIKLRIHRVDGVQRIKTAQEAKLNLTPFLRIHIVDIRNEGRWLAKPPPPQNGDPQPEAVIYCSRMPKPMSQAAQAAATGEDGIPVAIPPTKDEIYLPLDNESNPLSVTRQSSVNFFHPIDTVDCPGIMVRKKKRDRGERSWDFVFAVSADYLINPNVMIMFEVLEEDHKSDEMARKCMWGYLRLDQLYGNGIDAFDTFDVASPGDGGLQNLLEQANSDLTQQFGMGVQSGILGGSSAVLDSIKDVGLAADSSVTAGSAVGGGADDVNAMITKSGALNRNPRNRKMGVPTVGRFKGVWLQLHEYSYTKDKPPVCDDLQTPMVFHEMQDLRRLSDACLLVGVDLIDKIDEGRFNAAIAKSKLPTTQAVGPEMIMPDTRENGAGDDSADVALFQQCLLRKEQRSKCPLPEEFAYQLPSDGRGCFRVCFSARTSRLLACAVELHDETFEIRIFDLVRSQIHCVCHGHRELVYDMEWVVCPNSRRASSGQTSGGQQQRLDALKSSLRGGQAGNNSETSDDFPALLFTASSDGTCMVYHIPETREWKSPIYPVQTLYHPSYCYSIRCFPEGDLTPQRVFAVSGGHSYGIKVWRINRVNQSAPAQTDAYGNAILQQPDPNEEPPEEDWRVDSVHLCQEIAMEDHTHITCVRFGKGKSRDLVYVSHSVGYISTYRVIIDNKNPTKGIHLEPITKYNSVELLGTFVYNFEIVTEEMMQSRNVGVNQNDDWVLLSSRDNLIRLCTLQNGTVKVFSEMSGLVNARFPIRACISPDGRVVACGCESGRLFLYDTQTGKHIENWEARIGVQLSSPIVDVQWSRTHHLLAFCAFGNEEPPILVYRHVNSAKEKADEGRSQLLSSGTTSKTEIHHDRIADWASKWVVHSHAGVLGHDKKRELKSQILAQVVDSQRHTEILGHIERRLADQRRALL